MPVKRKLQNAPHFVPEGGQEEDLMAIADVTHAGTMIRPQSILPASAMREVRPAAVLRLAQHQQHQMPHTLRDDPLPQEPQHRRRKSRTSLHI